MFSIFCTTQKKCQWLLMCVFIRLWEKYSPQGLIKSTKWKVCRKVVWSAWLICVLSWGHNSLLYSWSHTHSSPLNTKHTHAYEHPRHNLSHRRKLMHIAARYASFLSFSSPLNVLYFCETPECLTGNSHIRGPDSNGVCGLLKWS